MSRASNARFVLTKRLRGFQLSGRWLTMAKTPYGDVRRQLSVNAYKAHSLVIPCAWVTVVRSEPRRYELGRLLS